jgi:hypothetical protein
MHMAQYLKRHGSRKLSVNYCVPAISSHNIFLPSGWEANNKHETPKVHIIGGWRESVCCSSGTGELLGPQQR